MYRISLILLIVLLFSSPPVIGEEAPVLAQMPTLNQSHIVFVFAGDLWKVPREGGAALRLTSSSGSEVYPKFSPDGSMIAFSGEYDGNMDIYLIPIEGGIPERITYHPSADIVLGWTPDGKEILFSSSRTAYSRFNELFTISLEGGLPEKLPLPMGFEGSYSPDGENIAYVPLSRAFRVWKRYRGGLATPVWIADLSDSSIYKVPRQDSNDFNPMWVEDKVYFLSDREGPVTLFAFDTHTKNVIKILENSGLDLKSASAWTDSIVYEQFGSLHLIDLESGKNQKISISVTADMAEVRDKYVKVGSQLGSPSLSPNAVRAVFQARGDIISVPAEKGDYRNLTHTSGVMERYPSWSPDGQKIAYFSDESGEYMLHIQDQTGTGEVTRIPLEKNPSYYYLPRWSPDNKKIAYVDCHLTLWYVDIETEIPFKVDKDRFYGGTGDLVPSWSPDSKWLAYTKRLPNYLGAIFLYSLETGKSSRITDGMSDARNPVFDKNGKYLYFTASTDSGASLQPDIHSIFRTQTQNIYLAVLDKDEPSPFIPESDEEKNENNSSKTPEKKEEFQKIPVVSDKASDDKSPKKEIGVKVDLEGILQRILAVPLPARTYIGLQTGDPGVLLAIESVPSLPGSFLSSGNTVHRYDLNQRKSDVVISGINYFELALNGKKYLYSQSNRWFIGDLRPIPPPGAPSTPPSAGGPSGKVLQTQDIQIKVSPQAEWRQMFSEVWRIEREFFYDPNLHGLDIEKAYKKYSPYLRNIASRQDLNYLFAEMLGEMTVGHLGVGGGDLSQVDRIPTGLLGADYSIEKGRYRFSRIYNGENWNPQFQAPLTQPGVNVNEGEYLLAVDGKEINGNENLFKYFEAKAGKQVRITVGANPNFEDSREITVVPVRSETALRNFAWIEENRRYVDKVTNGKAAYIYMPDTAFGGYTYFNRYFYAQVDREAAIIDERFNGGGMLATDIIERLQRKMMSLVATRDGEDEVQPQGAVFGPKAMLINEFAGSGGDAMPWYFKKANVGPLVGKRTWGGLVGRAGAPQLLDGGYVTAPSSGVWSPDGYWIAENIGVSPDYEVGLDPELVRKGLDPQLDKAIELVMKALAQNPLPKPERPAYPDYHKKK